MKVNLQAAAGRTTAKTGVSTVAVLVLLICHAAGALSPGGARTRGLNNRRSARVLLIPLDDRPPCLQFPVMQGLIADAKVVAPPREMLGRFTAPGDTEGIAAWVRKQELARFDAVVVSIDMLAYGGLVNSRVHRTPLDRAVKSLDLLRDIKGRAPRLPVYAFNVMMRLAPTADGKNEAYREKLSKWAEISPELGRDAQLAEQVARLEREIPAAALADYQRARARNLAVNQAGVRLVKDGVIDYLILAQDDAKPRGVHVADREELVAKIKELKLGARVAVQPGADEVGMLLLSRALTKMYAYVPRIAAVYSSEEKRLSVAPYEDRPLHKSVSFQIAAAGGREVENRAEADILFYVFASRAEAGAAEEFAAEIARAVNEGRRVIVADIDFKGDVQGGDKKFTEELRRLKVFPRLFGYASWNTAGNTIGTALPQGILYSLAAARIAKRSLNTAARVGRAQIKFLLHRLIDDYAYHSLVRPGVNRESAGATGLDHNQLTAEGKKQLEDAISNKLRSYVTDLDCDLYGRALKLRGPRGRELRIVLRSVRDFRLALPWGRTFEAEIDFSAETEEIGPNISEAPCVRNH